MAFDYRDFRPFQETWVPEVVAVHVVRLPNAGGSTRSMDIDASSPSDPTFAGPPPALRQRILAEPSVGHRVRDGDVVSGERGPLAAYALDPDRMTRRLDLLLDLARSMAR
ncbi:MAG TPA: hypothetical protein VI076_07795 [Actinopolymorphaceae bacterium]